MTDRLRKSHLRKAPQVGLSEEDWNDDRVCYNDNAFNDQAHDNDSES